MTKRKPPKREHGKVGVGMPQWLHLNLFGALLRDAFPGTTPYLVGSAACGKEWRDVDVRIELTPREWRRFVADPVVLMDEGRRMGAEYQAARSQMNSDVFPVGKRRTAIEMAFAELGRRMTGLPIDFQFMTRSGGTHYAERPRFELGLHKLLTLD